MCISCTTRQAKIIYIGKAKALKNRVSQYFGSEKNHDKKVRQMVSNVEDFEYILTDSEFEALVLECSLIKQHTPKYNILLKDDKGYHYIKVTRGPWPRISQAKQMLDDDADYIGPFVSSWATKETVDEALKIFRLPSCSRKFPQDIGKGAAVLKLLYQAVQRTLPGQNFAGGLPGSGQGSDRFSARRKCGDACGT